MNKHFRLPTLLIIIPMILMPIWYYINTDEVASKLFGEPLHYCNIIGCAVTKQRFFPLFFAFLASIVVGIVLLFIKLLRGAKDAKN